jgi:hypothetical protein
LCLLSAPLSIVTVLYSALARYVLLVGASVAHAAVHAGDLGFAAGLMRSRKFRPGGFGLNATEVVPASNANELGLQINLNASYKQI